MENFSEAKKELQEQILQNSTDWRVYYLFSLLYKKQKLLDKQLEMLKKTESCLQKSQIVYDEFSCVWEELDLIEKSINYRIKKNILTNK